MAEDGLGGAANQMVSSLSNPSESIVNHVSCSDTPFDATQVAAQVLAGVVDEL